VKNKNLKIGFLLLIALASLAWASAACADAGSATEHRDSGEHAEGPSMHVPNVINILHHYFPHHPLVQVLHQWEDIVFSILVACLLAGFAVAAARRGADVPRGLQNFFEFAVESLDNFVCGILGPHGRDFTPFIGTLFLYIFSMNLFGLIPFMKSPTSSYAVTLPLGITVFVYVQYTGIRRLGFLRYLDHLAGEPRNAVGFILIPLMLFLHVVGEFVKPVSLSLRLFGNIWGEDVLIAVFVGMGSALGIPVPLHFPFLLLALLTSFVQATVFCLLTTIYISLMLPHDEHEEEHGEPARAHAEVNP
jgi:F-type H+-transporting ATPase subunit a